MPPARLDTEALSPATPTKAPLPGTPGVTWPSDVLPEWQASNLQPPVQHLQIPVTEGQGTPPLEAL
jgi:hypothetical protein